MKRPPAPGPAALSPAILVYAPGRDGELSCRVLAEQGHTCLPCAGESALLDAIDEETGAIVVAEEALTQALAQRLHERFAAQPTWSDLPVIVVARGGTSIAPGSLAPLGNVSVLTRPMAVEDLATAVATALRARVRQFQVRDLLHHQQQQARRKDEFMTMLAHELRNPLAPIRYAATALQAQAAQPEQAGLAQVIERQVGQMGRIIDQLLDAARLTRDAIRLERGAIDLARLALEAAQLHAPVAASRDNALAVMAPAPLWVDGDETRLRQVLDNLIDNALKFSPPGRPVRIEALAQDGAALLRVADEGDGIDPAVLPLLFDSFAQADTTLDRAKGGLGLGLAMVRGIVELHGGTVQAQSAGRHRGSVFTVRLPLAAAPQEQLPAADSGAPAPAGGTVLVAEDNLDAAEMMRMLLELSGFEVAVVHSGPAAVEAALADPPQALVCDIGLPGMNGFDVARTLRADGRTGAMLMIAVTGYGSREDRDAALQAGFDAHFAKPVAIEALLEALAPLQVR